MDGSHFGTTTNGGPSGSPFACDFAWITPRRIFSLLATEDYLKSLAIDRFALRTAWFYGEFDAIHPFREGNSRNLRLFFHGVAHNAGFLADWRILAEPATARETLYAASDRAVMLGDSAPLRPCSPPSCRPSDPSSAIHFTLHP